MSRHIQFSLGVAHDSTAAHRVFLRLPGRSASAGAKFAMDSLLEGTGFEPLIPMR
jgi:hypothetical protein